MQKCPVYGILPLFSTDISSLRLGFFHIIHIIHIIHIHRNPLKTLALRYFFLFSFKKNCAILCPR